MRDYGLCVNCGADIGYEESRIQEEVQSLRRERTRGRAAREAARQGMPQEIAAKLKRIEEDLIAELEGKDRLIARRIGFADFMMKHEHVGTAIHCAICANSRTHRIHRITEKDEYIVVRVPNPIYKPPE